MAGDDEEVLALDGHEVRLSSPGKVLFADRSATEKRSHARSPAKLLVVDGLGHEFPPSAWDDDVLPALIAVTG